MSIKYGKANVNNTQASDDLFVTNSQLSWNHLFNLIRLSTTVGKNSAGAEHELGARMGSQNTPKETCKHLKTKLITS